MTVSEYERRFRELSDFCPNLVADEVSKKRRFLDGLIEPIALSLSGSDHPTYQSMRGRPRGRETDFDKPDQASVIRWIVLREPQSGIVQEG